MTMTSASAVACRWRWKMRDTLGKRLLVASSVLAVLVALIFATMLIAITDLRDSTRSARQSQQKIAAANALQALVLNLETSERGYVLAHEEPFLGPWKRAIAAFPGEAAALESLPAGTSETQRTERAIVASIRTYIREYAIPLVVTARNDPGAARSTVRSGEGRRRVDGLRTRFHRYIAAAATVSERAQARAGTAGRLALAAGVAGIVGAALLLIGFVVYLARTIVTPARKMTAEAEQLARRIDVNRALLDASVDGICLMDLDGRTVLANSVIERFGSELFGIPKDSSLHESLGILGRLADPANYLATMQAIADDPDCSTEDEFELTGAGRAFQRHTGPVRDAAGELIGRIVVIREVTAEHEAARLKSELVATVSHELRTPLAGVLGFVELLLHHEVDEPTSKRYLKTVHGEALRLTGLIDDFLDVQRIEAGRFTLALESFELGALLTDQIELYSAQSSRHALVFDLPDEPLAMVGERDRVGQLVSNLLSNAIKYSPAGGRVTITATPREGFARVCIHDTGVGIPAAQQNQVFKRFFRADSSDTREIGGTGLGLALCREIVAAHGGAIGFESEEGTGSTFWFELPSAWRAGAGGTRARVLVAEDEPGLAALLADGLALDGLEVELVTTGMAALEHALARPPAVICLDISRPGGLDALQVLAKLKGNPSTARVPVIMCTAEQGRDTAGTLGATEVIARPFSAEQMREAVARQLTGSRSSVLVVDDDTALRRLVVETLARDGGELREAAGGVEALAMIDARAPDVLVLDLVMPGLDGFGVLDRLLARADTRRIPVVVLTGRELSADERSLFNERRASVLEKSKYSGDQLRWLVRQAVGRETEPALASELPAADTS
jgi:signal transduction histidine kinase/DNA-binding response OmpR family regulator